MILVAAMAVGTLALRWSLPELAALRADVARASPPGMRQFLYIQYAGSAFNPYLATVTVAWLVIRLPRPHPGWKRLGRQPGFMACAVATAAMAIEAVWIGALLAMGSRFIHVSTIFVGYAQHVSFAVAGGWIALAISGRWRAEPGWIDRMGRVIGMVWILVTLVEWSRYFLIVAADRPSRCDRRVRVSGRAIAPRAMLHTTGFLVPPGIVGGIGFIRRSSCQEDRSTCGEEAVAARSGARFDDQDGLAD